jgi:hypothetical protein
LTKRTLNKLSFRAKYDGACAWTCECLAASNGAPRVSGDTIENNVPKIRMMGYTARRRDSRGVGRNGELRFVVVGAELNPLGTLEVVPLLPMLPANIGSRDLRERWSSAIINEARDA